MLGLAVPRGVSHPTAAAELASGAHTSRGKSSVRRLLKIAAGFQLPLLVAGSPGVRQPFPPPQPSLPWGMAGSNKLKLLAQVSSALGCFRQRCP